MFPKNLTWRAYYVDGGIVKPPTSSDDIDRDLVWKFILCEDGKEESPVLTLNLNPVDHKLIYRLRRTMTQDGRELPRVHVIGLNGKAMTIVNWVEEGAGVTVTPGFIEGHSLFYSPELRPQEIP